jgi:hypothetical protein
MRSVTGGAAYSESLEGGSGSRGGSINAIVTGDSLSDFGDGLDIQLGGRKHVTRDDVVRRLRSLLDLPVELVLPAHGRPQDRAALKRVLC